MKKILLTGLFAFAGLLVMAQERPSKIKHKQKVDEKAPVPSAKPQTDAEIYQAQLKKVSKTGSTKIATPKS